MKILVTGGLGFIGSHTVVALLNEGFEVVIIDNLSNSSIGVLEGITKITNQTPEFHKLDLRDKERVANFLKPIKISKGLFIFQLQKQLAKV